jgi:hypothetical protein
MRKMPTETIVMYPKYSKYVTNMFVFKWVKYAEGWEKRGERDGK